MKLIFFNFCFVVYDHISYVGKAWTSHHSTESENITLLDELNFTKRIKIFLQFKFKFRNCFVTVHNCFINVTVKAARNSIICEKQGFGLISIPLAALRTKTEKHVDFRFLFFF